MSCAVVSSVRCTTDLFLRLSATVPTVTNELGYTEAQSQLLKIPLYVFAIILVLVFAYLSDRFKVRWILIAISYFIAVCSFIAQLRSRILSIQV